MFWLASDLQVKVIYLQVTALSQMKLFSLQSPINKGIRGIFSPENAMKDYDS
jgi:hypothetical protein